jgi:ribosomal protein L37E
MPSTRHRGGRRSPGNARADSLALRRLPQNCHYGARRRKFCAGTPYARSRAMWWQRSTLLRRILFGARGNWLSFLARTKLPDPPARTRLVCKRCGAETPHDAFDDSGYGWYAQMWRCRVCGQESFKIWPVG